MPRKELHEFNVDEKLIEINSLSRLLIIHYPIWNMSANHYTLYTLFHKLISKLSPVTS